MKNNIVFIALCAVLFFSVVGCRALDKVDLLPDVLDNGNKSYLEGRKLQPFPEITTKGVLEGTLQDELEQYISDRFPARESVVHMNAASQRSLISAANLIFGFDAYPTFFGSSIVYDKEEEVLFAIPSKASKKASKNYESIAQDMSNFVAANQEIPFVVYIPEKHALASVNSSMKYVNNPLDSSFVLEHFVANLDDRILCTLETNDSIDEYLQYYYATDHHWNIHGAYRGYCEIAKSLDIEPLVPEEIVEYSFYSYGSASREGLMVVERDHIGDYIFDMPSYVTFNKKGDPFERTLRKDFSEGTVDEKASRYTLNGYFGANMSKVTYIVEENVGKKNLLLIGDSFVKPVEPMLAASYHETHVLDIRDKAVNIDSYVKENNIDEIVVLINAAGLRGGLLDSFKVTE